MTVSEPSVANTSLDYSTPPPDGSKPYTLVYAPDPASGLKRRNWVPESFPKSIINLRGKESQPTLDKEGFQFGVREAKHKEFVDDAAIQAEYYPESEQLIKDVTGASRVVFFDHSSCYPLLISMDHPHILAREQLSAVAAQEKKTTARQSGSP
jgi:hypothetical protein